MIFASYMVSMRHRCGKLIVATSAERGLKLANIRRRVQVNGVNDLSFLTVAEAKALEPELRCTSAHLLPLTGIVDSQSQSQSHSLMLALLGDAERHGAVLAVQNPFVAAVVRDDGIENPAR